MTSASTLDLLDLAAAALSSTIVASETIRDFCKPTDSDSGVADGKNARLKKDGTFVTDADLAAQRIITNALRRVAPDVRIVGEESAEDMMSHSTALEREADDSMFRLAQQEILIRYNRSDDSLPLAQAAKDFDTRQGSTPATEDLPSSKEVQDATTASSSPDVNTSIRLSERISDSSRVAVFVDPLDGTKAYAQGDYGSVSILIAIVLDHRPCFGVICKPFGYNGQTSVLDTGCVAIYGGTLLGGVFVAGGEIRALGTAVNVGPGNLPRAVISGSKQKGIVQDFVTHLGDKGMIHPEPMLISGAGEKSLRIVLRSENEGLWFFPKGGTSLWDVAASDALLRAIGGKLTDKFGHEMDYNKSRTEAENEDGVIACYDDKLHAECIRLFLEGSWNQQ